MLRINPLLRRRFADPELKDLVEEVVACQSAGGPLAETASDDLYRMVPVAAEAVRGRIVALRRDIHNGRLSGLQALEQFPVALPPSVARWADNDRRLRSRQARLREVHHDALARERQALRRDLDHRDFLITLAQSAPGAYDAARRYRGHDVPDSEDRKAERALVQYLTRAMARTSPYGRFTAVALAAPHLAAPDPAAPDPAAPHPAAPHPAAPDPAAPDPAAPHPAAPHLAAPHLAAPHLAAPHLAAPHLAAPHPPDLAGTALDRVTPASARPHVQLDRALFDHVAAGLVPTPADPLVAVPPTARVGEGRVSFFQIAQGALRRLSAPLTHQTATLVDLLALGPRRRSDVAAAMAERLGLEPGNADRLVGVALGLGLLVTAWRGDEFVAEPVAEALRDLAAAGGDDPEDLEDLQQLQQLQQVQDHLDRLGDDRGDRLGDDRAERADQGAEARTTAMRSAAAVADELSRRAQRPARLTVNEDFVLDPLLVDPRSHQRALDDLATVSELLRAFDRMHIVRALVTSALVRRFGPGCQVPLVEHAPWLVNAVYQGEQSLAEHPDAPIGSAPPGLSTLLKVRHEVVAAWRHAAGAESSGVHRSEVCWSPRQVAELVAGLPERFGADPASYGVVVQVHGNDLVLNDAYAGHGPMLSRFLHADSLRGGDATAQLRRNLAELHGPGFRLLEDRAWHGLSINAHPPILDEALDPRRWERLRLRHEVDTDSVSILDGDGAPVKVLALGAQLPELLPPPARLATWLCSSGRVVLDLPDRARRHQVTDASSPMAAWPRLRVGQVIVSRRRWYPGPDFPARVGAGDDIDYLLGLARWRARHDVPAEVMLKTVFDGPVRWDSLDAQAPREQFFELRRRSKPQYVDFDSALLTRVLPRLLERRPPGFLEEALPGLNGGGHASEWMVEMARAAGADRFSWRGGGAE